MSNEHENPMEKRLDEIINNGPETEEKPPRKSQADKLVELVVEENCILFHDQFKEPYAHVLITGHRETWKLKSRQFKRWLCTKYWESEEKAPHTNAISSALTILEGKACFDGRKIKLENRVAMFEGAIWYDLSNEDWQAVKISHNGWEIVNDPPILFRRYAHQQPQVLPIKQKGDLKALLPFVNLVKSEQGHLLLVYLASCFIPEIPHPIPILYGPQGAAKTTLARMLRALIDPSTVGVLSMPTVGNDLIQQISHHWFAFFDNVTFMPDWASDALCRAVTGEGFSKRELYSDDEDIIYNFMRCIGLNGINLAAKKPDLLDRGILFKLDRIANNRRKSERDIWKDFEYVRPAILGGIFDVISAAMGLYEDVHLDEMPRMADFTLWGCAIAEVLNGTREDFLKTYYANIGDQHEEAIHENLVATLIITFMEDKDEWEGSPSDFYKALFDLVEEEKLNFKGSGWPKSVSLLSRRINEVKTNLAEKNILVESEKVGNGKRIIRIENTAKNAIISAAPATIEDVKEIFGGEIVESGNNPPKVLPQDHLSEGSQNNAKGGSGDEPALPF